MNSRKPLILSMYLPQFHQVTENDKWWGEGFTDWISCKKAMPLYEGHYQPHIPMGNKYYDLLNKNTMVWQSELMRKYGIDGQCIYHYWFKNGKQLLEKPAENLLRWTDIDMPFCFSWANQTWARSWSKVSDANSWNDIDESNDKSDGGILLEQEYGGELEWKQHFEYLLPFFRDNRYLKIDNKPIFVIYRPDDIGELAEMMTYWRQLANENGFSGLYIVGQVSVETQDAHPVFDEVYIRFFEYEKEVDFDLIDTDEGLLKHYDVHDIWEKVINEEFRDKVSYQVIVNYDDTPRRGSRGFIMECKSPEQFSEDFAKHYSKTKRYGGNFIFLNAWNEWGEGMHLEPDEKNGYAYLEAIRDAKKRDILVDNIIKTNDYQRLLIRNSKRDALIKKIFEKWMMIRINGSSIITWFDSHNIHDVTIYGYGYLGRCLFGELFHNGINVKYIIDNNKKQTETNIGNVTIVNVRDYNDLETPVIVSVGYEYESIYMQLTNMGVKKIYNFKKIINDVSVNL